MTQQTRPGIDTSGLRAAAEAGRWTVRHIADATGLSRSAVYLILNGKSEPAAANLKAICDCIGVPIQDVFVTEAAA